MIRVMLPQHLRTLACVGDEVQIDIESPVTIGSIVDGLEKSYPVLRGTMRDIVTHRRRALVRFFACGEDLSLLTSDLPLPDAVATGTEPFIVIGAIAGG